VKWDAPAKKLANGFPCGYNTTSGGFLFIQRRSSAPGNGPGVTGFWESPVLFVGPGGARRHEQRSAENGGRKMIQEETVTKSREYAESIINTVREPLITLDQDLRVVTASRSFYDVFKVKPEETVGQLIYDLGNKQWDIPKLRELLETILPRKSSFDNYEVEHEFASIGRRMMLLNARQIQRAQGKERIILSLANFNLLE